MGFPLVLREALRSAAALVLPVACAGCGAPDEELCPACRRALVPCAVTSTTRLGTPVVAAVRYEGVAREAILAFKDARTGLASPLAGLLAVAMREHPAAAGVEWCAIPSSRAAMRRRGYDPLALLLARAGVRDARVLARPRTGSVQKSLGRDERGRNMADAHRARRPLDGRRFLLVDDVVTTGATLDAAAAAVRSAGGLVLGAAVVAATPLRLRHAGGDKPGHPGYGGAKGEKETTA